MSDCNIESMVSFDCGVASIFGQWQAHMGDGDAMVEYVNVIKDKFILNYTFQFPSLSCDVHGLGTKMTLRGIQPIDGMKHGSWFVIFGIW